ncbi:MAG: hypothetical protein GY757_45175 [bacterium]|nr:hypothetical protein [bacterium]
MVTELEKRYKERQVIKQESRPTLIISLAMLLSVGFYALAAYFIKFDPVIEMEKLENITGAVNLIVIMVMIGILGIRRSIYYSPRLIREDFTLTQVLRKWRSIDTVLLAITELVPITGMIITFLGMPFKRTFHFFVAATLLMFILMPVGIKIRSKLSILRQTHPDL